jgi:hypothetical protein
VWSDERRIALTTSQLLDEAVVALGKKRRGYEQALDAARDELKLVQLLLDADAEAEEASADPKANLRKRRSQLETEIRLLSEGLYDAEAHLKFMIGRWSEHQPAPHRH